jgi:hypothetical protein
MGQVLIPVSKVKPNKMQDRWYELSPRAGKSEKVSGRIHIKVLLSSSKHRWSTANIGRSSIDLRFADSVNKDTLSTLSKDELKRQEIIFELVPKWFNLNSRSIPKNSTTKICKFWRESSTTRSKKAKF